jgi:E3 ubiquitin-protein ligase UBR4
LLKLICFLKGYLEDVAEPTEFLKAYLTTLAKEFEAFKTSRFLLFLITSSRQNASKNYLIKTFSILNKLFKLHSQLAESKSNLSDKNLKLYTKLCSILSQLNSLANIDGSFLQTWLIKLSSTNSQTTTISSNETLMSSYTLKQLAIYLVQENETVSLTILSTLIQLGTNLINSNEGNGFPQLLSLMDMLASGGGGRGHIFLFQASCIWLDHLKGANLESVINNLKINFDCKKDLLQSTSHILSAAPAISGRIQTQIRSSSNSIASNAVTRMTSNSASTTFTFNPPTTTAASPSTAPSQSDSSKNKTTLKYEDSDVSYAKYGSFFCDCGAKEDGSCLAMIKRISVSSSGPKSASNKKDVNKEVTKINIKKFKQSNLEQQFLV